MKMKYIAVIQARMSSKRLPGKVLKRALGRQLLEYAVTRIRYANSIECIVVATSDQTEDNALVEFCASQNIHCVRGPLNDVAARFIKVFDKYPADAYIRLCGDSPFADAELIDRVVELYQAAREPDLATNVFPRTYPRGLSVEVINPRTFCTAYKKFVNASHVEHITSYFYENASKYKIVNLENPHPCADFDVSVNTPEQWQEFEQRLERYGDAWKTVDWRDLVRECEERRI